MGLFSFVKNAGAKILGKKKEEVASPAEKAESVAELVHGLDLGIEDFSVSVDGDKAILSGKASSQEIAEKAILAVGNLEGIATVDSNIEVASEEDQADFYTVQSGDSLSKIAKEFYGNAMEYNDIFEANKPMLEHPDKIFPGQVLRIPKK